MALSPVSMPTYPAVPALPGVPPMNRPPGYATALAPVVALVGAAAFILRKLSGPSWGIFDSSGRVAVAADTVLTFDHRAEARVADYPIELGGFASYNKVKVPFDVRVSFASDGSGSLLSQLVGGNALVSLITGVDQAQARRAAFLAAIQVLKDSLTLVTAVTPEAVYPSCNIVHYDYRREARAGGASMIVVDVWLVEIRITATATYTDTKQPGGANPANGGTRQTTDAGTLVGPV